MDLKPAKATETAAASVTGADDNDNNGDDRQQQERGHASESAQVKDRVKEPSGGEQASTPSPVVGPTEKQLTNSESRAAAGDSTQVPATICPISSGSSSAIEGPASETANECNANNSNNTRIRGRLVQAKSVSGDSCVASGEPNVRQPVAPPRARKRQSVPFARVPGELVARHNAALAEIAAAAEAAQIEEADDEISPSHPADPLPQVAGVAAPENDAKNLGPLSCGGELAVTTATTTASTTEIDNRRASSAAMVAAPISSKPQAAVSSVLQPPVSSSAASAVANHRSAPSTGSGAASTISSIFTKLMGKSLLFVCSLATKQRQKVRSPPRAKQQQQQLQTRKHIENNKLMTNALS